MAHPLKLSSVCGCLGVSEPARHGRGWLGGREEVARENEDRGESFVGKEPGKRSKEVVGCWGAPGGAPRHIRSFVRCYSHATASLGQRCVAVMYSVSGSVLAKESTIYNLYYKVVLIIKTKI